MGHSHKFPADGKMPEGPKADPPKPMEFPVMDVDHSSSYKPEKPIANKVISSKDLFQTSILDTMNCIPYYCTNFNELGRRI